MLEGFKTGCHICNSHNEYYLTITPGGICTTTHSFGYTFLASFKTIVFQMVLGRGPCSHTNFVIRAQCKQKHLSVDPIMAMYLFRS